MGENPGIVLKYDNGPTNLSECDHLVLTLTVLMGGGEMGENPGIVLKYDNGPTNLSECDHLVLTLTVLMGGGDGGRTQALR